MNEITTKQVGVITEKTMTISAEQFAQIKTSLEVIEDDFDFMGLHYDLKPLAVSWDTRIEAMIRNGARKLAAGGTLKPRTAALAQINSVLHIVS